ncbi:MAG: rhomboid family intramembrane serine protease [Oscillospiraceae bacterium]
MRSLNNKIDRFCLTHPRFGIPRLMLYIVIGNVIVYLFGLMDTTNTLFSLLYFDPALFCRGQVWRLLTFVLVPTNTSGIFWLAISLYFYYFIGSALEQAWGSGKFTIYYVGGLVLTALYSLILYWIFGMRVIVSASYLNLSLFFAFATLWPEQRVLLFFVIPVKMKWLAWVDAAFFLFSIVGLLLQGQVALALVPVVAMLTYLIFCGEWLFDMLRPGRMKSRVRQQARTVQFKQAAKKVQREQQTKGFTRQCAVCGRTDTDNPGLEFRFCSRCAGYHCFCADHINNHIHFTE